ncbi:transcriptional regulator [Labrys miyagiensis]|uniref:Transcriptional regulator n=1 Tax=Labrys miyagiensis TaxID=346912 RepID=A0ABQ6CGW1_9HYPH|nr:metalloregulator ArsR/SmtB family transcription factor [Labrys miyagiensis]GLS19140.1 transcriptional regulator [Labrys miyagiensis]
MTTPPPSLDLMFQALSDPTRRLIVERLSLGPASVRDLARPITMSLPSVLQHLQVLEASGLVQTRKVGRVRLCTLQPIALQVIECWVNARSARQEELEEPEPPVSKE